MLLPERFFSIVKDISIEVKENSLGWNKKMGHLKATNKRYVFSKIRNSYCCRSLSNILGIPSGKTPLLVN
jgi:hypothetical protein